MFPRSGSAQGTITFVNSLLTPVTIAGVGRVPTDVPIYYGVFWGTTAEGVSDQPAAPLGTSSTQTPGLITLPAPYLGVIYPIAGAEQGELVYLRIRGWDASYGTRWADAKSSGALYGETTVLPFRLGPTGGPGTPIWSVIAADKFRPLVLVPEPSALFISLLGVLPAVIAGRRPSRGPVLDSVGGAP